ncbi:MAG: glycine--tRNA ligase subunit beta [Candidatus Omnitrophica bacterium CG12_big_fil_rev_8_21_14_0_65_42_8]|nr:MAG: glycine--tRNA ligase subunit beta [Candidatus Omnitrophica bacterium CG12_big_fil_rev_8_21_14_0_65_42_8]
MKDFLLEINVEELPAGYVRPALDKLKNAFIERLKAERMAHGDITVFGTAAVLICRVKDMSLKQEELSREISGPPKRIAFDENNKPTPQAIGFAKNQGSDVKDLKIKQTPKGEYVFVVRKIKSRPAKEVLQDIVPDIIKSISFPKTMKWDDSGARFGRPIESILALLGRENINIKIGNAPARLVKAASVEAYLKKLEKSYILDQDKRKSEIEKMISTAQKKLGLDEYTDENLLEETTFMVKSPVILAGDFDKRFLAVPKDVLAASMSKYQRIFPLFKNGRLVNKFIAIIDGKGRDTGKMKKVYANILEARLKDSLFFYDEDTKKPFSDLTPKLKDLIFHKDLGNMFEKIQRLEKLSSFISDRLSVSAVGKQDIKRAAYLCKTDLVTQMVGEFPSLQGVMGMEYSLKSKEKESVAIAIKEHYLPKGMDGHLPETTEGAILAISDRIDNIVGLLGSGIEPKGSFDPFGIRRNSQGLIQIIKHKGFRIDLSGLIHEAIRLYNTQEQCRGRPRPSPAISQEELEKKVVNYIKERLEFLTPDTMPSELKQAVLKSDCNDIVGVFKRVKALSGISSEKYFLRTAKVCERTSNILKGAKGEKLGAVNEALLKEALEKDVWKAYTANSRAIENLIKEEKYEEATRVYGDVFFEALHKFFDKVFVNAEDSSLRENRLAMMQAINKLYTLDVADLALLPQIIIR